MEEVIKKEIRVTYFLDNEEDKKIYEELKRHKQPGRVAKELISQGMNNKNTNTIDISLEALKLIDKLIDKIENLNIGVVQIASAEEQKEEIKEVELNAEVSADDLDIDF